jgi:aminoglycoside phosphotransferase (APT) family kinase protein
VTGGLDHEIVGMSGSTVLRRRRPGADGLSAAREAALLALVAEVSPLPVPRVVGVWPERDEMEMERVPGVPLLEVLPRVGSGRRDRLGAELGRFVGAVSAVPVHRVADIVPVDDAPMADYLAGVVEEIDGVIGLVPPRRQRAVVRFLGEPPPAEPDDLAVCHHDLGAEHVFVDERSLEITGVIDWSDAAVADPALDLGLVLRDLGPTALDRALDLFGGDQAGLHSRAVFYARVRALEDLAYGVAADRETYRCNALRAIEAVF